MIDKRKTWFIDFDGTLVLQKSHLSEDDTLIPETLDFFNNFIKQEDYVIITTGRPAEQHEERIKRFMNQYSLKFDKIICDLPTGSRILINDKKNDGTNTAYSFNFDRDKGIKIEELVNL